MTSVTLDPEQPALTADEWRAKAEKLWGLLDDIDTYFDMFKPQMEAFERRVNAKCRLRFKELESDGYKLYLPKAMRR